MSIQQMADAAAEQQRRRDKHVSKVADHGAAIRDALRWTTRHNGRVDEKAHAPLIAGGWSDRRESPNDWAVEQVAKMVVTDSSEFQRSGFRVDAGETLLFARMLTHLVAETVPTLYYPNQVRNAFPVDNSLPSGANSFSYRRIERHAANSTPALLSPQADDVPIVTLSAEEILHRIGTFPLGIMWSMDELENAAFAGVPLQSEQLQALNETVEEVFEIVGLQGLAAKGFAGAYNNAGITITPVVTGTWDAATTFAQILGDLRALMYAVKAASGQNYPPNRLYIPSVLWQYLWVDEAVTGKSVYQKITEEFPGLQIMEIARADTYDAAGTGPRIMVGTHNSMLGKICESMKFRFEAPEKRGFVYRLVGRQKLGGFQCNVPLAYGYMDGC